MNFLKRVLCMLGVALLILAAGCSKKQGGSDSFPGGDKPPPRAQVESAEQRNTPVPENGGILDESVSQEEKPLLTLRLKSPRSENVFDTQAPVILRLEVFSPKVEFLLSQGREIEEQDVLEKLLIGSASEPWWQSFRLVRIEEDDLSEIQAAFRSDASSSRLDLTRREVGYLQLAFDPAASLPAGRHRLQSTLETGSGQYSSNVLEIELRPNVLNDAAKKRARLSLFMANEKYDEALSLTDGMIASDSDRSFPFALKADVLERMGRLKEAREMLIEALERYPSVPPGEHGEGPRLLMFRLTKLEERMGLLKKVEKERSP